MSNDISETVVYNIVKNLLGEIEPAGDTYIDDTRKKNLKSHILVMNMLLDDILLLVDCKNDYRESIKEIGNISYKELENLVDSISESLECYKNN